MTFARLGDDVLGVGAELYYAGANRPWEALMSRVIQVFNPVQGQKITRRRMNVMGRLLQPGIDHVALYLDKRLLRRIKPAGSGMFECRLILGDQQPGKHELELRVVNGRRTERLGIPFLLEPEVDGADDPAEQAADDPAEPAST